MSGRRVSELREREGERGREKEREGERGRTVRGGKSEWKKREMGQ